MRRLNTIRHTLSIASMTMVMGRSQTAPRDAGNLCQRRSSDPPVLRRPSRTESRAAMHLKQKAPAGTRPTCSSLTALCSTVFQDFVCFNNVFQSLRCRQVDSEANRMLRQEIFYHKHTLRTSSISRTLAFDKRARLRRRTHASVDKSSTRDAAPACASIQEGIFLQTHIVSSVMMVSAKLFYL